MSKLQRFFAAESAVKRHFVPIIGTNIKNPSNTPWFSEKLRPGSYQGLSLKSRQKSLRSRHREDRPSKAIGTELLGTEQAVAGIT